MSARITKDEVEAAVGTPRETSAALDWALQCYGSLEKQYYAAQYELRQAVDALREIVATYEDERARPQGERAAEMFSSARAWLDDHGYASGEQ